MITRTYEKVHVQELTPYELFNTFGQLLPDNHVNKNLEKACFHTGSSWDWYGYTESQTELDTLAKTGWSAGADKIRKFSDTIKHLAPTPVCRKRKLRWANEGDDVCVERVFADRYETAFRQAHRTPVRGPAVIDIRFNWGGNCGRNADELFWAGATGLVLTDILEDAGYAVRLIATTWATPNPYVDRKNKTCNLISIVLKEAHEPLRLDTLAFTACHAGAFRTYGFHRILNAPFEVTTSFGQCQSAKQMRDLLTPVSENPEAQKGEHVLQLGTNTNANGNEVDVTITEKLAEEEIVRMIKVIEGESAAALAE